jgi:rubrerythrin
MGVLRFFRRLGLKSILGSALTLEEEIYDLFAGLYRKSKIPFVRRAFRFLKEQEQTHVLLLERLLGKPNS